MAQKFPEIGLRIVLEAGGFNSAANRVTRTMRDLDKTIKQTAQSVSQSGQKMAAGFASSFGELSKKSKELTSLFERSSELASKTLAGLGGDKDRFDQYQQSLEGIRQETVRAEEAFAGLGDKANVNIGIFDRLASSGVSYADAIRAAGGQIEFNIDVFDRLIQKGFDADKAFQVASQSATDTSKSITILGRSFTTTAVALGILSTAITTSIALVRKSISEYGELAEATRRLRSQTGLLSREASQYVQAFQAVGLSSTSAARGMTQFLNKVTDLNRDLKAGRENTSDFAKAMEFLDVSVTNSDDTLKTTEQLLNDVEDAFQRLGPGVRTAEAAHSLFGVSAYRLLPLLVDQHVTLQDLFDITERYGSSLGALTQEQYAEFELAQFELRTAMMAVYNHIATQWIPVLTQAYRVVANVIGIYQQLIRAVTGVDLSRKTEGWESALRSIADTLEKANAIAEVFVTNFRIGIELALNPTAALDAILIDTARSAEELADAEEAAAQAGFNLAQSASDVSEALEEQLKALDKLKAQFRQKIDDIDADAEQGWNDILVQRQREAFDRSLANVYRMDDLRRALNEKLDDIDADFKKRWDDILVKRGRDAIVRAQREVWQNEDLVRRRDRSRADAIRDASRREDEIRRDARKRVEDAERDAREKREKLERDHQRRLQDIRQQFLDTALEAARDNDAVAVARAMRVRARELRDEQRRYVDEQRDLEDSLKKKRQQIEEDRREREEDHRQELARTLQRIEENHQRQVEELARQRDRQRILREQQEQWELDDFNKAKAEQLAAAQEWYDKQIEEMERQAAKEARLREIQYERQEIDFVKAWQRRIEDAREWYERERDELATHLDMTGQMLERAYEDWIRAAGEAVTRIVGEITEAMTAEILRWQRTLNEIQRRTTTVTRPPPPPAQRSPTVPRIPQQPIFGRGPGMAEGGVVQASSPTMITMGEAGPETAVFMPNRSSSMNVNHNFGRMGVDFQGLPGGMNTQQVQAIVYSVMTQLAKGVITQR